MVLENFRPTNLPNLWISQPTDFKYPEFLEISWGKEREFSRIDQTLDPILRFYLSLQTTKIRLWVYSFISPRLQYLLCRCKGAFSSFASRGETTLGFRVHEFLNYSYRHRVGNSFNEWFESCSSLSSAGIFLTRMRIPVAKAFYSYQLV